MSRIRVAALAWLFSSLVILAGCEINDTPAPPLTGPSELGTSIRLIANPDVLSQDGRSQSQITIEARDANGRPLRDVPLRAEIFIAGVLADFGRLSNRTAVTGSDGRALITYTAPPPPPEPVDTFTVVSILVTPTGPDLRGDVSRVVDIRLVPPGIILPPNTGPTASFTFSPQPVTEGTPVRFDATESTDPDGVIVSYAWDFGDGSTATGAQVTHTYRSGGTFNVTLIVTDDRGVRSAPATQAVVVGVSQNPTASFTVSPTNPTPLETVFFNASASAATTGRRIVSYAWTFGDGRTGSGVTTSNRYSQPGTYNVTLTVTDDLNRTGTSSNNLVVGTPQTPVAAFTFSPQRAVVGQQVNFDGTLSTAPLGRTIVSWEWNLGDTTIRTGSRISHTYSSAGTGNVVLTVTDSAGQKATTSQQIIIDPVSSQNPTASFSVSPSPAIINQLVVVDATSSGAPQGASIVSYEWNWGDSAAIESVTTRTHTHTYVTAGSYTITLTVVDSAGRRGTTTRTLVVGTPVP